MKSSTELVTRLRKERLSLLPAGLTIAVTLAWAATGGGYESEPTLGGGYNPDPWYLGALMIVGLFGATALGLRTIRLSRMAKIAACAFALYVLWSFLSIAWAHDKGAAFLGSNRAVVYLAAFLTFAILPWRNWSMRVALAMLVSGFGALAIVTTIRLAVMANPASLFLNARLSYPLGYYNADAAMFMTVAVTATALCSRRSAQPALRVAGIVLAALCLQLAVLGQSRGWLFTAPIVLLLMLVLLPGRLRTLVFALGPTLATVAVAPALLHLYGDATSGGVALGEPRLGTILHRQSTHAVYAMLIADALLAFLAALAVVLDRRVSLGPTKQRRLQRAGAGLAILALLAGVSAGLIASHGKPLARVEHAWNSFANANNTANGSSRFTTLGSQRVDFWRVALQEFERHPLLGIGQDNFGASYLRYRKTDQEPRWTHSLELRLLTHTGLIGALLFGVFLGAIFFGSLRNRGAWTREHAVIVAIALLPLIVWLVHGSIDWLWEFPALSVPALAFAGGATALSPVSGSSPSQDETTPGSGAQGSPAPRSRARSSPTGVLVSALACASVIWVGMLLALAVPYLSASKIQRAIAVYPQSPTLAYAELRSASNLMPFDDQIYLVAGAIGLNLEQAATARAWLAEAQHHDDQGWLAPFLLGLIEGEARRAAPARAALLRARALNPSEPIVAEALTRLHTARPMTFLEAQRLLASRAELRFGH